MVQFREIISLESDATLTFYIIRRLAVPDISYGYTAKSRFLASPIRELRKMSTVSEKFSELRFRSLRALFHRFSPDITYRSELFVILIIQNFIIGHHYHFRNI